MSASKPLKARPQGAAMLASLKATGAGAVVTLKLDRVFRSALDALATVESWDKTGVSFHMVDFGGNSIDTSTPAGKMFLTMMAGFAEFERGLIADRTRSAMAVMKAKGQRVGHVPYGKQLGPDGATLEDCQGESRIIERMKALSNSFSMRGIVKILNKKGHYNRGNPWTKSAIHRILQRN